MKQIIHLHHHCTPPPDNSTWWTIQHYLQELGRQQYVVQGTPRTMTTVCGDHDNRMWYRYNGTPRTMTTVCGIMGAQVWNGRVPQRKHEYDTYRCHNLSLLGLESIVHTLFPLWNHFTETEIQCPQQPEEEQTNSEITFTGKDCLYYWGHIEVEHWVWWPQTGASRSTGSCCTLAESRFLDVGFV